MNNVLMARRAELARALRNFHYEPTDDGRLYFPKQKAFVGGVFSTTVNGRDERIDPNTMTKQGLDDVLACYFPVASRGTVPTGLYFAPYINDVTPADTLTAANYNGIMDEFTNYTEATRPQWTGAAVSNQTTGNAAAPGVFTFGVGGGTVRGMALISSSAKESTSGKLVCCAAFGAARVLLAGDVLSAKYDLTATDA